MLKCREFVDTTDALLDGELTPRQRLSMRIHWLVCRHCRRYLKQLRALLAATPFMHRAASDEELARVLRAVERASATTE